MNPQLIIKVQNDSLCDTIYYSNIKWSDLFSELGLSKSGVCFIDPFRNYNHLEEIIIRFDMGQDYRIENFIKDNNFNSLHNNYSTFTQTSSIHISYRSDKGVLLDMIKWSKPEHYDHIRDLFQSNDEHNWTMVYEAILTLYELRE